VVVVVVVAVAVVVVVDLVPLASSFVSARWQSRGLLSSAPVQSW